MHIFCSHGDDDMKNVVNGFQILKLPGKLLI
jgi:hypothetical protein